MAYLAQAPFTNAVNVSRTPTVGNDKAGTLIIGPKDATTGPTIPTSGLIWWPKK